MLKNIMNDPRYSFISNTMLPISWYHDDVIKSKHFPRYWPFVREIHRSPVNSPHKGQGRGTLIFSLICTRINGWVDNGKAGDLRRNRAHYDVTVMYDPAGGDIGRRLTVYNGWYIIHMYRKSNGSVIIDHAIFFTTWYIHRVLPYALSIAW